MVTITVTLSEHGRQKLQNLVKQFNIPMEELLRVSFEELVARPPGRCSKSVRICFGEE